MAVNMATQTQLTREHTASAGTSKTLPPAPEEIAPYFSNLDILECLGRGGMGIVYRARQKSLNRLVALKILAPEKSSDPQFAARFQREAEALAKLNHPGIVTVFEYGRISSLPVSQQVSGPASAITQHGALYFLLMEFVDGITLRQLLEMGRISPREALAIVPQICDALQYAHDQGIVHRDIKPENILLDRQGRVKVADFGLAKLAGSERSPAQFAHSSASLSTDENKETPALTGTGKILGTPQYMAPEQIEHPTEVDHRADIYALGVVFYQMLTGDLPGKHIEPPSRRVSIDVRLDEVVLRALEHKPDLRYQQASAIKTQIETIVSTPKDNVSQPAAPSVQPARLRTSSPAPAVGKSSTAMRVSPAAIAGAVWIGLFFLNYIVSYTPPGWGLNRLFRNTPIDVIAELLVFLPLMILGFGALLGGSVMGVVALRQIRRARGTMRGFGLALFDVLFFPLVLVNSWAIWLAWQMISQILSSGLSERALTETPWAMASLALFASSISWFLVRAAILRARQFVNTPPPPELPRAAGAWEDVAKQSALRLGLVIVIHLAMFETLEQVSVHWRESTSELWGIALAAATLGGLTWAFWPGYQLKRSWLFWVGGTTISSLLLLAIVNFYSWHLRPNLGLNREPDWVAQHPEFQKKMQREIEKNLW